MIRTCAIYEAWFSAWQNASKAFAPHLGSDDDDIA
jgi:hypothetical protein